MIVARGPVTEIAEYFTVSDTVLVRVRLSRQYGRLACLRCTSGRCEHVTAVEAFRTEHPTPLGTEAGPDG